MERMELRPLAASEIGVVAGWLNQRENYEWVGCANGLPIISPARLEQMTHNEKHCLMVYGFNGAEKPWGLVALSNIDKIFQTSLLWYVLGNKEFACYGHTSYAVYRLLRIGFFKLGLRAIHAWTVDVNLPSIRVLQKNGFRYIGKQKSCHVIDGTQTERLQFELISAEYDARNAA
jgi:RimJ/RimL family protein N-acetyltransferase